MYLKDRLCVPSGLGLKVVGAQHLFGGHMGVKKLVKAVLHRYKFGRERPIWQLAKEAKAQCNTCQACEHPNWPKLGPITMNPVPPRVMSSVCLDIFSPPGTRWQGLDYDALLLCVDRHSGWIAAIPTQKKGLTAEKVAHIMMDNIWSIFGVPTVVTSEQGLSFVRPWWRTVCAKLGIRTAYRKAHRAQGNGRAEVARKANLQFAAEIARGGKVELGRSPLQNFAVAQ